ncbi:hypothetical protein [Salipiger mangrovisoli]|uniref:Uncharacterized protein n=1 Tax=Salipiger mangrovisoli TaxID=2865933 RepID=A0ABR9WWX9_9RHOB|nr:hypothetical protein [Salipiger mangrovisoli]MBE9635788.1 hypothetical protein [Salipiger mangrovisoli]
MHSASRPGAQMASGGRRASALLAAHEGRWGDPVEAPDSINENVVLWLTVARTRLGKNCRLTDWTPLVSDCRNLPLAGTRPHPGWVRRQIGNDFEKLRVEMVPPPGLLPGWIELYLVLDYDCSGKHVPDRTDGVTYQLLG